MHQIKPHRLFILLAALGSVCSSVGATERIETDGPDFVESAEVVGKNRFQLETSVARTTNRTDTVKERTTTTPTLLRLGVSDTLELRLEGDGATRYVARDNATGETETITGTSDTAFGVKWKSHKKEDGTMKPSVAWILHVEPPSGSKAFRRTGTETSLRSAIAWDLPNGYSAGLMPGIKRDRNEDRSNHHWSGILGATVAKNFTDDFRIFVELAYEDIRRGRHGGPVGTANLGTVYMLNQDWLVGGRMEWAITQNTPDQGVVVFLAGRF